MAESNRSITATLTAIVTLVIGLMLGYFFRTRGDEKQIRYTRLYEQRATILAGLSEKLYKLHNSLKLWTSPLQTGGEEEMKRKRGVVADAFNEFSDYYYSNSLWLDDETGGKIEAVIAKSRAVIFAYDKIPGTGMQWPPEVEQHLATETDWVNDWDRIPKEATSDVGEMKKEIDREFKDILGISQLSRKPTRALRSANR